MMLRNVHIAFAVAVLLCGLFCTALLLGTGAHPAGSGSAALASLLSAGYLTWRLRGGGEAPGS